MGVFDEMNGSAGIQSNADSMIVISSNRKMGTNPILSCLPKDAEQKEFEISLNTGCKIGLTNLLIEWESTLFKVIFIILVINPSINFKTIYNRFKNTSEVLLFLKWKSVRIDKKVVNR